MCGTCRDGTVDLFATLTSAQTRNLLFGMIMHKGLRSLYMFSAVATLHVICAGVVALCALH